MPADAIVNAYQKLMQAIQGVNNSKDNAQIEALEQIGTNFQPGQHQPMRNQSQHFQGWYNKAKKYSPSQFQE